MAASKPYQVVVWGATGVVGRCVCEHLARDYHGKVKWAMAARSRSKLESLKQELSQMDLDVKDVPVLTADVCDREALRQVVAKADVLLSTAGPYARIGTPVVDACVEEGTSYCDITGELTWMRRIIEKYEEPARAKGIKVVHCCGFDSIPSDLGTLFVVNHVTKVLKRKVAKVEVVFGAMRGALSGGTIASGFGMLDEPANERKAAFDPYSLDPSDSMRGPDGPDSFRPGWSALLKKSTMPFIMAPVNARIVRRSNALLGHAYGKHFSYNESMGTSGSISSYLGTLLLYVGGFLLSLQPLRPLLIKIMPKPGQMPPKEKLVKGWFKLDIAATIEAGPGEEPQVVTAEVKGKGDPGYWFTSRALLETGLCLVQQAEELKAEGLPAGGVLTPSTAGGMLLLKRLERTCLQFSLKQ